MPEDMPVAKTLGHYVGEAVVEFLEDGRRVRLLKAFGYVDSASLEWHVPAKAIVDGASIPRALWSLIGGPFEGRYRAASVIHDWYCDLRSRPWRTVHRMFFEAMLASGVSTVQAKLLYAGVYWGGPRWTKTVSENVDTFAEYLRSSGPGSKHIHYPWPAEVPTPAAYRSATASTHHYDLTAADLALAEKTLDAGQSLDDIDRFVDAELASRRQLFD